MKFAIILLIVILLTSSCSRKEDLPKTENHQQNTLPQGDQAPKPPDTLNSEITVKEPFEFTWDFQKAGTGKNNSPKINLYLVINNQKIYISTTEYDYQILPPGKNKENDVPAEALTACRGWWAGWGEDYWVIKKDKELEVILRYIGEPVDFQGNPVPNIGKTRIVKKIRIE